MNDELNDKIDRPCLPVTAGIHPVRENLPAIRRPGG